MFIRKTADSCARAWAAASNAVIAAGDDAYNVVIDVKNPVQHDPEDNAAISLVDQFLKSHGQNPIVTVANTIFPSALYRKHGSPGLYDAYFQAYDRLTETKRWGRYFERMTRHRKLNGTTYNPLQDLIDKMKRQEAASVRYSSAYELAVYDPLKDGRMLYGGQCLSYLSFKRSKQDGLMLTALYRNHTYITRCLGNLIGLGRLQEFVAKEVGIPVSSLTCISTHAQIDKGVGWGIRDARNLIKQSSDLLVSQPASV